MTNFRYAGYLMIALGFINLRYHTGHHDNFQHSILLLVIPGTLLLASTFTPKSEALFKKNYVKIFVWVLLCAGVLWALLNS